MENNAFTEGVAYGGLRNTLEVRILICYLLKNVSAPLSLDQMNEVLSGYGVVNYFELVSGIESLVDSGHIDTVLIDGEEYFVNTDIGNEAADSLGTSIPSTIRQRTCKAALDLISKKQINSENKVEINKTDDGYTVRCTMLDVGTNLLLFELFVPDKTGAEVVRDNFLKDPGKIYRSIVSSVIGKDL